MALLVVPLAMIGTTMYGCSGSRVAEKQEFRAAVQADSMSEYASMGTAARDVQMQQMDLQQQILKTQTLESVPQETVTMSVSLTDVAELPDGAGYNTRNGRASVAMKRTGDSVEIIGNCDSLERRCDILEYRASLLRERADSLEQWAMTLENMLQQALTAEQTDKRTNNEKKPPNPGTAGVIIAFVGGVATGAFVTVKINKLNHG